MGVTSLQPRDLLPAFERSGDAAFAVDADMRIVFWNEGAERVFGRASLNAIGLRCDDVVGGIDGAGGTFCEPNCSVIQCARRGHAVSGYDLRVPAAGDTMRWLSVSIVVLRGRGPRSTIAVHLVRDITEQRRFEVAASRSLLELQAARDTADAAQSPARLTRREADVLRLLACGHTNARIAAVLGISPTTVRNHIEHLLAKLGVHSKLEAVVYATTHHII
jgi:PAS domain S-box-containing protein